MSNLEAAVYMLVGLIIGVILHEYMHGYVAYRMGDTTAKRAGRLTLDPMAHIDPIGTLLLPGILFLMSIMGYGTFIVGYAKPVPVNPFLFRRRSGIIWVSLAGPFTNLAVGAVFMGLAGLAHALNGGSALEKVTVTFIYIAYINLLLFVFNLIPVPPLDGSKVVGYFLKGEALRVYRSLEPYGFALILVLVFLFGFLLSGIVGGLANIFFRLFGLPYRF